MMPYTPNDIRSLVGRDALLIPWELGKKCGKRRWKHLDSSAMDDPRHLNRLEMSNIGVVLGRKSAGLCSIDFDVEEWAATFLAANPAFGDTLRTRGARGCNFWARISGEFPSSFKLKEGTEDVGEWRADGSQTIIAGQHPSGCWYSFLKRVPPIRVSYSSIVWPEGLRAKSIAHSAHSSLSTLSSPSALMHSQAVSVGVFFENLMGFVPRRRGQSNAMLWAMAGQLRRLERDSGRETGYKERMDIFKEWWNATDKNNIDASDDQSVYLTKWLNACDRRERADDETAVSLAWDAVQIEPLPDEATAEYDFPMPNGMKALVALCRQLQLAQGDEPFFLSQREAGKLLETPNRTVGYWLEILAREDGPFRLLRKVSSGSHAERKANEYRFLFRTQEVAEGF